MKHTKRLLKQVFGKKKTGIKYIKRMLRRDKDAPSLFIYSTDGDEASSQFLDWLATIASSHSVIVPEDDFHHDRGHSSVHSNILVDNVHEVSDPLIEKVVKTRGRKKRIVVASKRRPKALDYVSDPSLIVADVEEFNLNAVKSEIPDFINKIS
jgi:hypothetical protein